ncbi:hypothetical protein [Acaryochloris sp. CCMEE 5410]|uniref:hypothetical protein n=1 Tax=Acaryochloris sp. CCMEE 5410 TaxID=310037 RepID=UPI0002484BBB|nr:hypothetical protein [Acaryochloris sp. CCMEE 5410]KAI9130354.1 hypothetical protein ON05_021175 [Acaryochloris sp. CCMEE 5410]
MLSEINNPEFARIKTDIAAHSRLHGYYILGLVSIHAFRTDGTSQEIILKKLIDHFDDDPTEPDPDFVPDHGWTDYETTLDRARAHTIESLVGGRPIGHANETMSEQMAGELFDRFVAVCGTNPRFYIGLGIGDRKYAFMYGVLIVADDRAGILWIVESD